MAPLPRSAARLVTAALLVVLALVPLSGVTGSVAGAASACPSDGGGQLNYVVGGATGGTAGCPGYRMVSAAGVVGSFGGAAAHGDLSGVQLTGPVVGMAATPDDGGYWLVAADGGVFAYGDAGFYGSAGNLRLTAPVVGMAATPDGRGYWLVAADGGVFAYGDASFDGSAATLHLTKPVVGMAASASGGYWLVAADGGIFNYGAPFEGSAGALTLSKPVVGMAAAPSGTGYWLIAADGGVFNYGNAGFAGSAVCSAGNTTPTTADGCLPGPGQSEPVTTAGLGATWHAGCPVAPSGLRVLGVNYWGFDNQTHVGSIVVNTSVVGPVQTVFGRLLANRFPIREMIPQSTYGGDDNAAAAADDTSGFNCRNAVGSGTPSFSMHAYGEAIDVNDVENPYVDGSTVIPPAGAAYENRADVRPGMAEPGGTLNSAFAAIGWGWGGNFAGTPDYQHFSINGH